MIILSQFLPSVSQGSFFQEHISFPVSSIEWSWWVPLGVVKVDCHWQKLFNDRSAWWEMVKPGCKKERREIYVMIFFNLYLWLIYDYKGTHWHCVSFISFGFKWEPQRQQQTRLSRKSYVHAKQQLFLILLYCISTAWMCSSTCTLYLHLVKNSYYAGQHFLITMLFQRESETQRKNKSVANIQSTLKCQIHSRLLDKC